MRLRIVLQTSKHKRGAIGAPSDSTHSGDRGTAGKPFPHPVYFTSR